MTKEPTGKLITVQTLVKGPVEVAEDRLLTFVSPLLGFDPLVKFLVYQTQDGPMYWLQSVEKKDAAFCLLAPFQAGLDPDMEISDDDVRDISAAGAADITVYTIVVLDRDPAQVRTNLRAPILVCHSSGKAKQIVLNDSRLPIRFFLSELHSLKRDRK